MSFRKRKATKQQRVDERRVYFEVGFRIRIAREATGQSQSDLAKALGCNRVTLSNIERAAIGGRPSLFTVYRIASILGVKASQLFPGMGDVA